MRLGVLDVGSNTVHFLVIDARRGGRPLPVFSHKAEFHLGDHLEAGNRLSASVTRQLRAFVDEALQIAEDKGVEELLAFATSAVRDAANGDEVLSKVKDGTGVAIRVLPGEEEARLTFLAAGAVVADAAMDLLGLAELEVCPWALREGVLLRRIDTLAT